MTVPVGGVPGNGISDETMPTCDTDGHSWDNGMCQQCGEVAFAPSSPNDDEHCRRCGAANPPWSAPSPLWNAVMRGGSIDGPWQHEEIICPNCFIAIAEGQGAAEIWRVSAERVNVPLEMVTPSGRVWDDQRWLWSEMPNGGTWAADEAFNVLMEAVSAELRSAVWTLWTQATRATDTKAGS